MAPSHNRSATAAATCTGSSSEGEDIETDQVYSGRHPLFRGPRIQAAPSLHRYRIAGDGTQQIDSETCLIPNLKILEWSGIPDPQL
jgi:hypothetical protein